MWGGGEACEEITQRSADGAFGSRTPVPDAAFMETGAMNERHHVTDCTEVSHGAIMGLDNDADHLPAVRGSPAVWAQQRELDCIEMVMLGAQSPAARIPPALAGAGARSAVLEAPWAHEAVSRRSTEEIVRKGRHDGEVFAAQISVSDELTGRDGNRRPARLPAGSADAAATAGLEALVERCQWRPHQPDPRSTRGGREKWVNPGELRPYDEDTRPSAGLAASGAAAIGKRSAAVSSNAGQMAAVREYSANAAAAGTTAASPMREACAAPQAASGTISAHRRLRLEALQLEGKLDLNAGVPLTHPQHAALDAAVVREAGAGAASLEALGRAPHAMGEGGLARWYDNAGLCTPMQQLPEHGVLIPRGTRGTGTTGTTATGDMPLTTDCFIPASPRSLPAMLLVPARAGAPRGALTGEFSVPGGSTTSNSSSNSSSSCSSSNSSSRSRHDGGRFGSLVRTAPIAVHAALSSLSTHLNFAPSLHDPKHVGATVGAAGSVDADEGGGGAWDDAHPHAVQEARTGVQGKAGTISRDLAHDTFVFAAPPPRAQHPVSQSNLPVQPRTSFTAAPQKDPPPSFSWTPATIALPPAAHPTTPADGPVFPPPSPRSPRPSAASPATASLAHSPRSPSGSAGMGNPTARSRLRFTSRSLPRPASGGGGSTSVLHSMHSSYGSDLASGHVHALSSPLHASVDASLPSLPRPSLDLAAPALSPRLPSLPSLPRPLTFSPGSWDDAAGPLDSHEHATTARVAGTVPATADASLLAKRRRVSPEPRDRAPRASSLQQHAPAHLTPHAAAFPGRAFHRSCSTPVFSTACVPSAAPPSPSLHPSPLRAPAAAAASLSGGVFGSDEKCADLCLTAAPFQGVQGAGSRGETQQMSGVFVRAVESMGAEAEHRARATIGGLSMEMRRGGRGAGAGAVEGVVTQLQADDTHSRLSIAEQLVQFHSEPSNDARSTMVAPGLPHLQAAMSRAANAGEASAVGTSAGTQTDNTFDIFGPAGNTAN
ncbi:unnamed protein product [Closterium sp. Yama58-4]|nr:unnamed protein product [Closterium sp. Yama58-4]